MVGREPAPADETAPSEAPGAPRYLWYYGLEAAPFRASIDPGAVWLAPAHRAVLSTLTAAITADDGLFLLTGDIGTGKTSLAHRLAETLSHAGALVGYVCRPGLDLEDFRETVLAAFQVDGQPRTRGALISSLQDLLDRAAAMRGKAVIVIDEAQNLSPRLFQEIREVLALAASRRDAGLAVLLVGHTTLATRFAADPNTPAVRAAYTLPGLSAEEVASYIRHALAAAGSSAEIFSAAAVREIASLSLGAPGAINIIADRALLMGEARGVRPIQRAIIQHCCKTPASPSLEENGWRRAHAPVRQLGLRWSRMTHSPGRRRIVLVSALLIGILATGAQLSARSWLTWPWHEALDEPSTSTSAASYARAPANPQDQRSPDSADAPARAVVPSGSSTAPVLPSPAERAPSPVAAAGTTVSAAAEGTPPLPPGPVRAVSASSREVRSTPVERATPTRRSPEAPPAPSPASQQVEAPSDGPDPSAVIDWLVRESSSGRRDSR